MNCVEKIAITFNELNDENDYFIETMEREELAEFIKKCAKAAGLARDKPSYYGNWKEVV